jgi:cephalosporin hydroxylase
MKTIHELYLRNARHKSDINELLPILLGLATTCEHVVELGFRTGVSTSAFLAAGAGVTSYDIHKCEPHVSNIKKLAGDQFTFIKGDSLKVDIPYCDLLFIDSYHTGSQLLAELIRHQPKVGRYIVMHDTKTFGEKGEDGKIGLVWAMKEFYKVTDSWKGKLHLSHNNGLSVMERV